MTRDYTWVYLCSSIRRLRLTLKFLPSEMQGLREMVVCYCSHLDPPERRMELERVLTAFKPAWLDATVMDLSSWDHELPDGLKAYWSTGKPRWSLGVKLAIPAIFTAPLLYTDDDIIICKDPSALMQPGQSFASGGNFPFFRNRAKVDHIRKQLAMTLAPSMTANDYDKNILDAGFFYLGSNVFELGEGRGGRGETWTDALERFSTCPYIQDLKVGSHEFRRLDQRFITAFGFEHRFHRLGHAPERRNFLTPPPKNVRGAITDTYFVHYMSKQYKDVWMDALDDLVL